MEQNQSLGNLMVQSMSKLSLDDLKYSMMVSFQDYKKSIFDDEPKSDPWLHFLDLVALKWGYYGDLDIYIEEMETRLATILHSATERDFLNDFIKSVGDHKEQHDKDIEQMKKDWEEI